MTARPKPLVLSMGDPAGIGPELAMKAWLGLRDSGPAFALCGSKAVIEASAQATGLAIACMAIEHPSEAGAIFGSALPVIEVADAAPCQPFPGTPDPAHAALTIGAIRDGVSWCLAGEAAGIVTLPIAKAPLATAGFGFPGHTEYLASLAPPVDLDGAAPVMMLVGQGLRVGLATIHLPLAQVPGALSTDRIMRLLRTMDRALRADFGLASPRISVAGLNPHAGESGTIGTEEVDIIAPAVTAARREGITAAGPAPADTLFHPEARAGYDAVLAMYHDQGLVPLKMLAFWEGVNVTLGLPIVRTSPDHGTAFGIAGRGIARVDSTLAAIRLAAEIAARRAEIP